MIEWHASGNGRAEAAAWKGKTGMPAARTRRLRRGFSLLEIVVVLGVILLLAALVLAVSGSVLAANDRRETENVIRLLEQATTEWEQALGRPINYGPKSEPGFNGVPGRDVYEENATGAWMSCVLMQRFSENERTRDIVSKIPETYSRKWRNGDPALPTTWASTAIATDPNQMQNPIQGTTSSGVPLVLDAWGFRIGVCFPGRPWRNGTGLSTTNEAQFYSGGLYLRGVNAPASGAPDADGTEQTPDERTFGSCRDRRIRFVSAGPDGSFGNVYAPEGSAAKKQTQDNIVSYE
jgi:prepilin-type N-terminal cleavage/methylation domain-containing protein